MKNWIVGAVLVGVGILVGVGLMERVQGNLSDETIEHLVDRMMERQAGTPTELRDSTVAKMVDAMLAHPAYQAYLDDDAWVEDFTSAMLVHPSMQTTPDEDCATIILMAAVMTGDYSLPPKAEADSLCAWYSTQAS